MKKIYINNLLYKDLTLTDTDIVVYLFLKNFAYEDMFFLCADTIIYDMFGTLNVSRRDRELISNSMLCFADEIYGASKAVYKKEDFVFGEKELFATVYMEDVRKILDANPVNKYSIIRYLITIMGSFKFNISHNGISNFFGNEKISYFCSVLDKSKSTIMRYNKILEDLEILYINHAYTYFGELNKHDTNIYGRYADKKLIDDYAWYWSADKFATITEHRSLGQKYSLMMKGQEYPPEVQKEIRDYVVRFNSLHPGNPKEVPQIPEYAEENAKKLPEWLRKQEEENNEFLADIATLPPREKEQDDCRTAEQVLDDTVFN